MAKVDDTNVIQLQNSEIEGDHVQNILSRREKNSQLPISSLPTETLINIFMHYKMMLKDGLDLTYCVLDWMDIAYVCHHWRQVILNFPLFWARIRMYRGGGGGGRRWFSTFLSRSQAVPLAIHASVYGDDYNQDVDLLVKSLQCVNITSRIHELDVTAGGSALISILECFPIPSITEGSPIRSLVIKRSPHYRSLACLPKTFTSPRFPHLQRLQLWGCDFDWDSGVFKTCNLTSLAIDPLSPSTQPTESQLLSFLKNLHLLEDLFLGGYAIPRIRDTSVPCINLPHLRVLKTETTAVSCLPLMRIITFPRTMADISLSYERSDFEDIRSPLLPFFDDYYKTTSEDAAPNITKAKVVIDGGCRAPLLFIQHACGSSDSAINVCLTASSTVSNGSNLCLRLIDLIAASPLRFLRNLTLNHVWLADNDQRRLLNCLVNLETMRIDEKSFLSMVSALTPAHVACRGGDDQGYDDVYHIGKDSNDKIPLTVPASNLRSLHIYLVDMHGSCKERLLLCLEMRLQAGHGLAHLELYCRYLEEEDVELYRKVVGEVVWDRKYAMERPRSRDDTARLLTRVRIPDA